MRDLSDDAELYAVYLPISSCHSVTLQILCNRLSFVLVCDLALEQLAGDLLVCEEEQLLLQR